MIVGIMVCDRCKGEERYTDIRELKKFDPNCHISIGSAPTYSMQLCHECERVTTVDQIRVFNTVHEWPSTECQIHAHPEISPIATRFGASVVNPTLNSAVEK